MTTTDAQAWVVHKFGGSSVADARCFERVAAIVESQMVAAASGARQTQPRLAIVLSACKGVTDALLELVALAESRHADWRQRLAVLRDRHAAIATALLDEATAAEYLAEFDRDVTDLTGVLQSTSIMRSAAQTVRDLCSGYGEIWSTQLFRRYLQRRGIRGGVQWLDARRCVTVEWGPLGPAVQWRESKLKLQGLLPPQAPVTLVITGFIASDPRGVQTTLGRNGSDFSASIFGALLDAAEIHIWTDVDGVLSADPRRVPDAQVIDSLSYNEAMELAYFGAKVIHPQTMAPAVGRDIPIWIRNTFAPDKPGTLICARPNSTLPVKGITSIEHVALVNLEGAGMIGVPGTAHRLFGALREEGISVILISQGSSEHSICCAIPQAQAARAKSVLETAFARELAEGQIQNVDVTRIWRFWRWSATAWPACPASRARCSARSAMRTSTCARSRRAPPSATSRWWSTAAHATRALRAAHASFYLSPHTLSIGVIGPGTVGRVLLDQLAEPARAAGARIQDRSARARHPALAGRCGSRIPALRTVALARGAARSMHSRRIWRASSSTYGVDYLPHTVLIDCSADAEVAAALSRLARGRHSHRDAEQEGQQRHAGLLREPQGRARARAARITCTRPRSAPGCR